MEAYSIQEIYEVDSNITAQLNSLLRQHVTDAQEITVEHVQKILSSDMSFILVAVDQSNTIIGMVSLITFPKLSNFYKSTVEDMVVDENHRRQGIGEALMRRLLVKAKELGLPSVTLTSKATRIAANALYQKLGFKLVETNYYRYQIG